LAFNMADESLLARKKRRLAALKTERVSFDAHWRELARLVKPRRGRFYANQANKGGDQYQRILNDTATQALRTATSGLLAGIASPSRPWFQWEPEDQALREFGPVKVWLHRLENKILDILNQSNFYNMTPTMLSEALLFGTGAMSHMNNFEDVARFYAHTIGSYYIAQNDRYEIDTFVREYEMTVEQIFRQFGKRGGGGANNNHISSAVRTAYDRGNYDIWFPVIHFIEPNDGFRPSSPIAKNFAFSACYFEPASTSGSETVLREGGHKWFPIYVPRWDVTGEDVYGTDCPGMVALGGTKQLQIQERRKAQAIDKMVNPPLQGPASLKNVPISSLPGGANFYNAGDGKHQLTPVYTVDPRLGEMRIDMAAVERRINTAFFVDLFMAITNMEGIQPRNEFELAQRNQERLLHLGPPLERLHGEFLAKVVENIFLQLVEADALPADPPLELQGQALKLRFVSSLAMAQRAVATGAIERTFAFAGGLAGQGWPEALQKLDPLQAVDEYAMINGAVPTIVVSDDVVAERMAAQQQAQARQMQMQMAGAMAKAGKDAAGIDMAGDNLASQFVDGLREQTGAKRPKKI
jgi:hypothetical protein